jgi:hypothetical protein
VYAGPSKVLRVPQISGWITSEVMRRKKACVAKAMSDACAGVVESADLVTSGESVCVVAAPARAELHKSADPVWICLKPSGACGGLPLRGRHRTTLAPFETIVCIACRCHPGRLARYCCVAKYNNYSQPQRVGLEINQPKLSQTVF